MMQLKCKTFTNVKCIYCYVFVKLCDDLVNSVVIWHMTDRRHSFKSSNMPKSCGWPDSPQCCDSLMILKISTDTKRGFFGAKVFCSEHAIAYPNHSFKTCGDPEALTTITTFRKCGI